MLKKSSGNRKSDIAKPDPLIPYGNFWVVLEEKRREIIKEWINSGRIKA